MTDVQRSTGADVNARIGKPRHLKDLSLDQIKPLQLKCYKVNGTGHDGVRTCCVVLR